MADAPLSPRLQDLLFQHRLQLQRDRLSRPVPTVTVEPLQPMSALPAALPRSAPPPPERTDLKTAGGLVKARLDSDTALAQEEMRQAGMDRRALAETLAQIEMARFKLLARKGGGYGGRLQAYLKARQDEAAMPEDSASRDVLRGIARTFYQGLTRQQREQVEASGMGFGLEATGQSPGDVAREAEATKETAAQAGREKVAQIGASAKISLGESLRQTQRDIAAERNQTQRDIAAGRMTAGEKPQDAAVRQAMGLPDVRAAEAAKMRAGGKQPLEVDEEGQRVRLPDGTVLTFEQAHKRGIRW